MATNACEVKQFKVLANDSDPEGSSLTLPVITVQPKKGTATVDASGNIVYTPDPNFYGLDSLIYQVGEAITGRVSDEPFRV